LIQAPLAPAEKDFRNMYYEENPGDRSKCNGKRIRQLNRNAGGGHRINGKTGNFQDDIHGTILSGELFAETTKLTILNLLRTNR